ncbi:hypothetical protein scyTo_0002807 [Scyliorhinus torazame]|uniref:C2H2-type domain-containing protein n=1 Tax=Scyliorhinus torazame TaxID=75743 RepID=A0A401PKR6_SCYTO|nr:hypothetical protein [Scyliorhinus torazame]
MTFKRKDSLLSHQMIHTGEKPFPCKAKLAHNTQERSVTGEQIPYIKELTEQEELTRKLFGLSNPTITNGRSDMGMSEDTELSMDTSDGDGGELAAASAIPERADEEGTEVNSSQQCGMAAAVEEGEEYQKHQISDLEASVDEFKLNIVACVKEEACDALAAMVEGGRSEPSAGAEHVALGAEAPPPPRAHGQHPAHTAGEENEDDLKSLEHLHQEQVKSTESYQATSILLQETLTEFKMDVSQNLQRSNEILQRHLQRNTEIIQRHLQRNIEIFQQQNEVLRQQNAFLRQQDEIQNKHLQRNNEIFQQQKVALCHLLQRSNETLNVMRPNLSPIVATAPSGQQKPSAETSAAGHAFGTGEVTPWGQGRHRPC